MCLQVINLSSLMSTPGASVCWSELMKWDNDSQLFYLPSAVAHLYSLLYVLLFHVRSLKHCILPPVPGPKIKGFDKKLLKVTQRTTGRVVTGSYVHENYYLFELQILYIALCKQKNIRLRNSAAWTLFKLPKPPPMKYLAGLEFVKTKFLNITFLFCIFLQQKDK